MTPQTVESLPIILVSAKDEASATSLIKEIIDNIPEDITYDGDFQNISNRVWRIKNKYYTADVRLHPLGDQQELNPQFKELIEAHVIYLSPEEVVAGDDGALRARAARLRAVSAVPAVQLAALDHHGHRGCAPLAAAARALAYEPVPLRPVAREDSDDGDDDDDDDDGAGLPRLRAALHAHVWPAPTPARDTDDSDDEWGPWCAADEADEVGGDEAAFAEALRSLPSAAAAARSAARSATGRAARLAAADHVLAAFCRALRLPPP